MVALFRFFWGFWIGISFLLVFLKSFLSENYPFLLPETIDSLNPPIQPPSWTHFFGTDELGRDVLVRLLYGTGFSLMFSSLVAFLTLVIGFCMGLLISFSSKRVKRLLNLGTDVLSALPFLPIALIGVSFYPSQVLILGILKSLLGWGPLAQMIRMESELVLTGSMIEAATTQGISRFRIATKHVLPILLPIGLSFFPFLVFSTVLTLATLDFFGLAFPIPTPNLAEMFRQFQEHQEAWWLFLFPLLITAGLLWGFQTIDQRSPNSYPFEHGTSS